jgi:5'-nucleotidase
MRLLITNDDGIDSVFLHELVHALRAAGHELAVVAPQREQSWVGAGKSRHRAVRSGAADRGFGCPTWIVDGTPSDCVNIALAHLLPIAGGPGKGFSPEAVVSGINLGLNASLGFILASGTVAGAWEGVLHGLPGIALSQDLSVELYDQLKAAGGRPDAALLAMLRVSAGRAAELVPHLARQTAPRSFVVHNINFPLPCRPDTPVRRTVPARVVVPGLFGPAADDGTHRFVFSLGEDISPGEPMSDRAALAAGLISHTVLDYSRLGHA